MKMLSKLLCAAVATALSAGSANAGCWSEAAYRAAQVRELDTMLMVEALRCRKTLANFIEVYNQFVVASRPALLQANTALRGHFAGEVGERGALNAYDNYMTTVANRYGAGSEGLSCDDMASITRAALATNGSADALYDIAVTAQMIPTIQGDRCQAGTTSLTVAVRR